MLGACSNASDQSARVSLAIVNTQDHKEREAVFVELCAKIVVDPSIYL
jgi:hypothetical protein